ncbi:hypothetical protein [Leptothoe spongobia]
MNDDRLGQMLDQLYAFGTSTFFPSGGLTSGGAL